MLLIILCKQNEKTGLIIFFLIMGGIPGHFIAETLKSEAFKGLPAVPPPGRDSDPTLSYFLFSLSSVYF